MIQKEFPDWYYNHVRSCPAGATAVCDLVFALWNIYAGRKAVLI